MIKVSIIIPVYNVANYIERCITSVIQQTYNNIEIILIDDCGTDNSMEIAHKTIIYSPFDTKIVKHDRNQGLSAARNSGLKKASGDYVYFLDSDDAIANNTIELLAQKPNAGQFIDFIIGDMEIISGTKNHIKGLTMNDGETIYGDHILSSFANNNWYVMACNKLVKLNFIKETALYFKEGIVHEDVLWSFLLANKAKSMDVVKKPLYKYYIRPNSIVTSPTRKNIEDKVTIASEIYRLITNNLVPIRSSNIIFSEALNKDMLTYIFLTKVVNNIGDKYFFYTEFRKLTIQNTNTFSRDISNSVIKLSYKLPKKIGFIFVYIYTKLLAFKRVIIPTK